MAQFPKLTRISREEYPGESSGFYRLLDTLSPFVSDVTGALSGALDARNYRKQFADITLTTRSTLQATFSDGKVSVKSKIGTPRKVSIVRCVPTALPSFAQETWTAPTLENSWVVFGGGFQPPEYRLVNGKVELRGLMKNGTIGAVTAFTLPWGPPESIVFDTDSNNAHGGGRIFSSGIVQAVIGNNAWFSFEGVSFEPTAGTWTSIGPFGPPIWDYTQSGNVRVNYIAGLSPLTEYQITLELE